MNQPEEPEEPEEPKEPEEPEINPRTGLPYRQSSKLRAQKLKWRNANKEVVCKHVVDWQKRNRAQMYSYQKTYQKRLREERLYFLELFGEGLVEFNQTD